jgi:hypothetical protein
VVVSSELVGPAEALRRARGDEAVPGRTLFDIDPPANRPPAPAAPAWPAADAVVVVTASPAGYNRAVAETARRLVAAFGQGVVVGANRPSWLLREALAAEGIATDRIVFVDCVTTATGLPARAEPNVVHIESAALLEKVVLRSEQALRRLPGARFLLVDSLCAFAQHNGTAPAAEFAHALTNRVRALSAPTAWMVIDRDANGPVQDAVRPMCDGSLRL